MLSLEILLLMTLLLVLFILYRTNGVFNILQLILIISLRGGNTLSIKNFLSGSNIKFLLLENN